MVKHRYGYGRSRYKSKRKYTHRATARKGVRKIKKAYAKRIVAAAVETKRAEGALVGGSSISTTWGTDTTYKISQGDTTLAAGGRDGDQIEPTFLEFRHQVHSALDTPNTVRIMIVQMKKAEPTFDVSFLPDSVTGCVTQSQHRQYYVLFDRAFTVRPMELGGVATITPYRPTSVKLYRKKMQKMRWKPSSTTAVAADIQGAIRLCWLSDSIGGPHPTIDYEVCEEWKEA